MALVRQRAGTWRLWMMLLASLAKRKRPLEW